MKMQLSFGRAFVGMGTRATAADVQNAAGMIGCDPLMLRALLAVETSGRGFDDFGRPMILFEPHIMWNLAITTANRVALQQRGVAYPSWGMKPYPPGQDAQYQRIEIASAIVGVEIAEQAASWGLGQILGRNYKMLGYASSRQMVNDVLIGEGPQITQIVKFLRAAGIDDDMRREDFEGVAAGWNGKGNVAVYSAKLRKARDGLRGTPTIVQSAERGRVEQTRQDVALHPANAEGISADELNDRWLKTHPNGI